jgi:hypothetical protein
MNNLNLFKKKNFSIYSKYIKKIIFKYKYFFSKALTHSLEVMALGYI